MSMNETGGGAPAQMAPSPRSSAEQDSLRRAWGQAHLVIGRELLSDRPDGLKLRQAQKVVGQVQEALSRSAASAQASQSPAAEPRPQVGSSADRRVSSTSHQPLPADF